MCEHEHGGLSVQVSVWCVFMGVSVCDCVRVEGSGACPCVCECGDVGVRV